MTNTKVEVKQKEQPNQLQLIVQQSGLEQSKAQYILEKFQDYFEIAAEWEQRAKTIVVTSANQVMEMQAARTGRLIMREKRLDVERARKELKEQSLREGKAIDGIANVLKALIIPIEEHLEQQEKFVEIQAAKLEAAHRAEVERRMEEERIAAEKAKAEAEAKERERMRIENEKLAKELAAKERAMKAQQAKADAERKAADEKARKEREAAELQARKEREALEEKNRIEREKQAKIFAAQKAKADADRKKQEAALKKIKEDAAKKEAERKELELKLAAQVTCPECGHKFTPKKGK